MFDTEHEARKLIKQIADEVSFDATQKRTQRSIQLILESFAPDHIITELLQNADDVGASHVEILLTDKGIFFKHNGYEFDEPHLRALCDIGETTKKPGIHIGFMGIGFKAAFKISNTPHVFSGPYRFYFNREKVIVPHWLEKIPSEVREYVKNDLTIFYLPFRQDLPSEIIDTLSETMLRRLEPLCIVFLKNIEKIVIISDAETRVLIKAKEAHRETLLTKEKFFVTEKGDGKERTYNYLVFNKMLKIPEYIKNDYRAVESRRADLNTTVVTLAFSLKDDSITPVNSVLYTFLPTPFKTGFRFAVNCDFILNTQRTEIDFVSQWNNWLLESIGDVLKMIIHEFVQDEKLRLCFCEVLPRKREVSERLYAKIAVPLIDHIKDTPLILTACGELAKPSEVILASEELQKIIPPEKVNARYYVNSKIRGKVFLKEELGIRDLTVENEEREIVFKVLHDMEWLTSLNVKQVRAIYEFLYRKVFGGERDLWKLSWYEHRKIIEELKEMEIIKSTEGSYHIAEDTIIPESQEVSFGRLISLPCLIFVDPLVLSDQSQEFLKNLGAKSFTEESIIARILDSQGKGEWKGWKEEEWLRTLGYVANWLEKNNYRIRREIKDKLGVLILPVAGGGWAAASTCYIHSLGLKEILPGANYVDISMIEAQVVNMKQFFKALNLLNYPRVLQLGEKDRWVDTPLGVSGKNWEDYWWWLSRNGCTHYSTRIERVSITYLDGFDECVASQDIRKLTTYLNFLLIHWDEYYQLFKSSRYHWFYYSPASKDVPSYLVYQLKTQKWIPTIEGLVTPSEVFAPLREIRRFGGGLIRYLNISENKARKKKEFLKFLGIETEVNLQMLLFILIQARDAEVNDVLKAQLGRIYQRIATLCEDEKIDEEVYILDRKGNFKLSRNLYWLDDPEAESVFGEEILTAWVPEKISRPHIKALFNALGVTSISSILERKRIDYGQEVVEDVKLTNELKKRGDYLHSVLLHHKSMEVKEFTNFIRKVVVTKVNRLGLELKVLDNVHEVEVPCFCSIEENKIFISHEAQKTDVARELARSFKATTGSEFTLSFVLTETPDNILEQLRRSSIQIVPFSDLLEDEIDLVVETKSSEIPLDSVVTQAIKPIVNEFQKVPLAETPRQPQPTPSTQEDDQDVVPEVSLDINRDDLEKEVESMRQLLTKGKVTTVGTDEVWRKPVEIEKVTSEARIVVRSFVSASTKKNWELRTIDGEKLFVEVEMDPYQIDAIQPFIKIFRDRMRKIIEIMGGNPDTVNVCVVNTETDGDRREGQLFFNVLRKDKPLRWIVVAARELAYVKFPKPSQAHISLMTDLIVKALERIKEIYPDIFSEKFMK